MGNDPRRYQSKTDFFEKQYCFYMSEMSESFYDTYEYKRIGEN